MMIIVSIFFLSALGFAAYIINQLMGQIRELEDRMNFFKGIDPEAHCMAENKYLRELYKSEHEKVLIYEKRLKSAGKFIQEVKNRCGKVEEK